MIITIEILGSSSQVFVITLSLASVVLATTHLRGTLFGKVLGVGNLLMVSFLQLSSVEVIGLAFSLFLLEELATVVLSLALGCCPRLAVAFTIIVSSGSSTAAATPSCSLVLLCISLLTLVLRIDSVGQAVATPTTSSTPAALLRLVLPLVIAVLTSSSTTASSSLLVAVRLVWNELSDIRVHPNVS